MNSLNLLTSENHCIRLETLTYIISFISYLAIHQVPTCYEYLQLNSL